MPTKHTRLISEHPRINTSSSNLYINVTHIIITNDNFYVDVYLPMKEDALRSGHLHTVGACPTQVFRI